MPASTEGRDLVVRSGTNQVTLRDVLVGEVWLLGGQSNMSFPLWVRFDIPEDMPSTALAGKPQTIYPWDTWTKTHCNSVAGLVATI